MPDSPRGTASSRHHISTACAPCRKSKIKCTVKKRKCVYNTGGDKRKISLSKSIKAFSSRVRQLEEFIVANGLQVPPAVDTEQASTLESLAAAYGSPDINNAVESHMEISELPDFPPSDPVPQPSVSQGPSAMPDFFSADFPKPGDPDMLFNANADWIWSMAAMDEPCGGFAFDTSGLNNLLDPPADMASGPSFIDMPHQAQQSSDAFGSKANDDISTDDEDHDEVTGQLSDRLGTLLASKNGDWRFYGATSNLHLVKGRSLWEVAGKNYALPEGRTSSRLELFRVAHPVDADLTRHLIKLYFAWHNASLHVVDQELFEKAIEPYFDSKKPSKVISEFLVNSMCAIGAAYEDNTHADLPTPLPEFFARRAKALLDLELDEPTLSTVQGLTILSCHEAAMTRDTRAWLFSGMAIRLAFDLGLHISTKKYVEERSMSASEAKARSITIWGCFMNDRAWGLYLGRPFHTNVNDIVAERPLAGDVYIDVLSWSPVSSSDQQEVDSVSPNPSGCLLERWISLHEIMSTLGHNLYVSEDVTKLELQALAEQTYARLLDWEANLPYQLVVDKSTLDTAVHLPQVLVLQ
ncbi:hypothetical protein KC349_g8977 [Hortaea werneckii]|nr:hypothetical protein KC349_g8977 [Hortaea werneckii]